MTVFRCRKEVTEQWKYRDIWVWLVTLGWHWQQGLWTHNTAVTGLGDVGTGEGRACVGRQLAGRRSLTIEPCRITSLLNAKGQESQLCGIVNATKTKNNVLVHCEKKTTRNLLYTATSYTPRVRCSPSLRRQELKQVGYLVKQKQADWENENQHAS